MEPSGGTKHPSTVRGSGSSYVARPRTSVVSVSSDRLASTARTFADRVARWRHAGVELILVCAGPHTTQAAVSAINGHARLIYGPPHATERELLTLGFAAAIGDVVVLVDDPAVADEKWIEHVNATGMPPVAAQTAR